MSVLEEETTRFLTAWMQVRQIVQAANFNRFQRAGLSATQFMTLNLLPPEGMTLSGLARKLNLSAPTLNETVNSLQERGFVRRRRNPRDARQVIICATRRGERMQNSTSKDFHAFISELFRQMSEAQREGLMAGLEQMVRLSEQRSDNEEPSGRVDGVHHAKRSSRRSPAR
jgi:DNA-binding MarR family transcriptional regulator